MGAFSALLAGFGKGFGDHTADVIERKRQEDVQNKRIAGDAILDYVKNNDNLSPEDQERGVRQVLKLRGVKDADADAALGHLKTLGLHPTQLGQAGGQTTQPSNPGSPAQGQPQTTSGGVGGAMPAQTGAAPQGASQAPSVAGPMPTPPNGIPELDVNNLRSKYGEFTEPPPDINSSTPRAVKDYYARRNKFYSDKEGAIGKAVAEDEAARANSARDLAKQQGGYGIYKQMEEENEKARSTGAGYRRLPPSMSAGGMPIPGRVDRGVLNPGYTNTEEIIGEKDDHGQQISDPSAVYRTRQFADGDKEHIRVEGQSRGAVVTDPNSPTGYSYQIMNKAGKQIGLAPNAPATTRYGSSSSATSITDESGNVHSQHTTVPIKPGVGGGGGGSGVGGSLPVRPGASTATPGTPAAPSASTSGFNPTADAADLLNKRISPSQYQSQQGIGKMRAKRLDEVKAELRKVDPNFNWQDAEANYQFAKSPNFQNTVRYIDNTLESLPRLQASADKLANGQFKSLNALKNMTSQQLNGVDIGVFNTDRVLIGDEIAKILQGGNNAGVSDAKLTQAQGLISGSDDPKLVAAKLKEIIGLIALRRGALTRGTPYERGGVGKVGIPTPGGGSAIDRLVNKYK